MLAQVATIVLIAFTALGMLIQLAILARVTARVLRRSAREWKVLPRRPLDEWNRPTPTPSRGRQPVAPIGFACVSQTV